jgi:hypothetical protein
MIVLAIIFGDALAFLIAFSLYLSAEGEGDLIPKINFYSKSEAVISF